MTDGSNNLVVRQSARHDIALRASMSIDKLHAEAVRFSSGACGTDGRVGADVVDVSTGGIGLMSPVFIPRKAVVTLEIFGLDPQAAPLTTVCCRVQRVMMTDRRPAYLLGLAFERISAEESSKIQSLLDALSGETTPPGSGAEVKENR